LVLTLLAALVAALIGLAIAARAAPPRAVSLGTAGISALVVLLTLGSLASRAEASVLALPIGPLGGALRLALDPLGAAFLLLLFVPAIACAVFADAAGDTTAAERAGLPGWLAAVALVVLAYDAWSLTLGLTGAGVAGRLLLSAGSPRAAQAYAAMAGVAAVCLVIALALMAPPATPWLDCDFAAIRAVPVEGWRTIAVLILALTGAAALVGVPAILQSAGASAPLVGIGSGIGIYLLLRMLLDLSGPPQSLWTGVPLLLIGGAAAVFGCARTVLGATIEQVLAVGALQQMGLAVMAIGVALAARATDLTPVASLALAASWLLLVTHALCRTALLLCAGAVRRAAGTDNLGRPGGLIHRMPVTALCTLIALLGTAMLPPGLGFAGFWLLIQSLLGAFGISGPSLQIPIALAVLLAALSAGVAAMAAVRLAGVTFLGRPRTPRVAVAEEVPRAQRLCLVGITAMTALLAVLPGLALLPASRALARLANGSGPGMPLVLKPAAEAPGYAPLAIGALLVAVCYALLWLSRRRGPGYRREPAWTDGFAPPPPWLPFGDPATQIGAASLAEPLRSVLGNHPAGLVAALRSCRAHLHAALRRAPRLSGTLGLAGSVAITLAALVVAIVVWLSAS
jgi:NADH:ubiquinone oxidoreductase subunit 5 (subunit L)/multisubunit Na+/H+ antiporter MnhA subunit